jgi:glycosyltransferase involved in cell wall biosynthesis
VAPIRILRVITRLNIGGPSRHVVLLSRDLDDGIEFQTTLVSGTTAPHEGDMLDYAHANGVGVELVPTLGREISPADDLVSLARLVKLMRWLRPDVVHTHMAKAGTVGRLAAMVCRVPLIVHTYHGHVFHSYFGPLKTRVFITIERALGMGTSRIVTVGDSQRDEIASYGVAPRDKLVPIRLGLELQPFLNAEQARGQLRSELGVATSTPLIGIVARLVPIKAHETFFEAARIVHAKLPEAQFLVLGDGERRAELEALVRHLNLEDSVRFLGWRHDMLRIYADLDVVALSSRNEGSPVSLIEALAAARPVVSTAVGGVPEVVIDGVTGLTVPASDAGALADGMLSLLIDRSRGGELGAAGRRHVYPRYDSSRLVDDMRTLYLREISARGRRLRNDVGAAVG